MSRPPIDPETEARLFAIFERIQRRVIFDDPEFSARVGAAPTMQIQETVAAQGADRVLREFAAEVEKLDDLDPAVRATVVDAANRCRTAVPLEFSLADRPNGSE